MTPTTLQKLLHLARLRAGRAQWDLKQVHEVLKRIDIEAAALNAQAYAPLPTSGSFDATLMGIAARGDLYRHANATRLKEERLAQERALMSVETTAQRATAQVTVLGKMLISADAKARQIDARRAETSVIPPTCPDALSR
ncbi:MAG: hypothetical protein AAGA19_11090 [Pseudomonadota bacterium]